MLSSRLHPLLVAVLGLSGVAVAASTAPARSAAARDLGQRPPPPTVEIDTATDPAIPTATDRWPDIIAARLATLGGFAPTTPRVSDTPAARTAALQTELSGLARMASRSGAIGVSVQELDSGATLFEWDGQTPLNPASGHKLLTTTAAVALLGADYRFETEIARSPDTLYIVGSGDPSLQVEDLASIARRIAERTDLGTVRHIVVDDTAFSPKRFGPGYDPGGPGYSYMAPSGALSVQFNTLEIVVRPGASGQPPRVEVDPPCAHVIVDNRAVTGRGRPLSVRTLARGEHTVVELTGSLAPSRRSIRMRRRITDPSRFAGTTLAALLAQPGEHPLDVQLGVRPTNVRTLLVHRSAPLPEVLGSALEYSNNFTTEQVVRTLGHRMSGAPGDWHNGSEALRRFWTAAGLPADAIAFENASGLSREGRVTPHALVGLLRVATRSAEAMIDAMAVAGREGTLRGRLRHTHGRVRAKSGTLRGVSGLSGVITSRDGEPQLGFSILMGGRASAHRARRIQDRFVRTLVAHLDTRE